MLLLGIWLDCHWLVLTNYSRIYAADVRLMALIQTVLAHRIQLHANSSSNWSNYQKLKLGPHFSRFRKWGQTSEGRELGDAKVKVRRLKQYKMKTNTSTTAIQQ